MSTTTVTKRDAEKFLAALKRQRDEAIDTELIGTNRTSGPELVENWDWLGTGPAKWSIVWEEGPYEWAILFPFGGVDEEFGYRVSDVSAALPAHLYAEPITSWAVGIFPI